MHYAHARQPARTRTFAVPVLLWREMRARLSSAWFFVLASAVCLIATAYGGGFQSGFETETVLVTDNPLAILNVIVAVFLAVMAGVRLAASLAWEREHGTLEVLLISPATQRSVVIAKFAAELAVLALLLAIYGLFLVVGQPLGPGVVMPADLVELAVAVAMVLPVMALGLLVAAFIGSVRGAVIAYLVIATALAAFEFFLAVLQHSQPQVLGLAMLYLRAGMEWADRVLDLVSWVAPVADLVRSVTDQIAIEPARVAWAVVIALLSVGASAEILRMRDAA
jgi:ABC-type transport system involved in multi-copper enzyme maturation permease subunit